MKNSHILGMFLTLSLSIISPPATATLFQVDVTFTANNFQGLLTPTAPPDDFVSGSYSFLFDDSSLIGNGPESIHDLSLTSLSMTTIDGHAYSTSDTYVNMTFSDKDPYVVTLFGVDRGTSMALGTNDFGIHSFFGASAPPFSESSLAYTTTSITDDVFRSTNITDSVVITSVVSIPAAVWLFGSGLLGLAGIARRKKV